MRRATNNYGIVLIDDKFIGISLGFDFCAEHEWGIEGIKRICGMPEPNKKNMGVKSRSITKTPVLVFNEGVDNNTKHAIMYTGVSWRTNEELEKYTPRDLEGYVEEIKSRIKWSKEHNNKMEDPIITAWSGSEFGVAVYGDKETEYLNELYQAFQDKNITIATINLKQKNPFSNNSLMLAITDRLPIEVEESMYLADKEYYDREDYEKKIGMKKLIEKNKGKYGELHYFMACSPKWINYSDEKAREESKKKYNTKYDIIYWVNYSDDDNNYGWYTVEEIRKWMKGNKKLTEIRKA